MYQTAWTKKVAPSSVPSDRLRPKPSPTPPRNSKNAQSHQEPQSKALRTLNAIRTSLQDPSTSTASDPTGGCFCQARTHPLSPYVPICTSCAIPLCNLASPAHLCPSCKEPLLSGPQRGDLIVRIDTDIADTTLKEQLARERAEEARRAAAGAFPTLSTPSNSSSSYPSPAPSPTPRPHAPLQPQTHKVLSLNSKTKKTILTTTTIKPKASASPSPQSSRPASPQPIRKPRPDAHIVDWNAKGKERARGDPGRPWANLSEDALVYVQPVLSIDEVDAEAEGKKRSRRKKGKAKEAGGDGKNNAHVPGSSGYAEASGS
ncbi:hypothetical protein H0H87_006119 [Tephrocybe sp. NHM501043]|nr:hypothetical protein H0H87_006119 [Tephrocybe sp. NHM501043]